MFRLRAARRKVFDAQRRYLASEEVIAATRRELGSRGLTTRLRVVESDRLRYRWDAIYAREAGGFRLELPTMTKFETAGKAGQLGPAYLYWLTQCGPEVEQLTVSLSDGDQPQEARFSPSTNQPHVVPIPDPYFFYQGGFNAARRAATERNVPWSARSDVIAWRGASSGIGTFDPVVGQASPVRATQRLMLCLAARDLPGVDVGLASYARDEMAEDVLRGQGIVKGPMPENSWLERKFAIDVDGQSNTWSNFLVRLHYGCCVLKVASKEGYRQWYYDKLKPFEHYVPVKADFSDFAERVDWLRSHDKEAAAIAANGQAFARSMTFEEGRRQAVELISRYWNMAP